MESQVGLVAAFGAGVVSFLSPCVLPLVPGYVAFLSGVTPGEEDSRRRLRDVLVPSLLFVAGFTVVFVALGASASALGSALRHYRDVLAVAGGVVIAAFGVLLLGVLKVPWLYTEARFDPARSRSMGRWTAPAMGVLFAVGWTPCVGPVLGSILMLAGSQASASRGSVLLLAYSSGLALPFIATALLVDRVSSALKWMNRHTVGLNRVAGIVLVVLGVLMATGKLAEVTGWLSRVLPIGGTA